MNEKKESVKQLHLTKVRLLDVEDLRAWRGGVASRKWRADEHSSNIIEPLIAQSILAAMNSSPCHV
jgi:hypothetical protein